MNEQALYQQYYDYFLRDISDVMKSPELRSRLYIGNTSKAADELIAKSMPQDEQSRAIMKKAAEDALKAKGYSDKRTRLWLPKAVLLGQYLPNQTQAYGNTAAMAVLEKLNKDAKKKDTTQTVMPNFTGIAQDPEQLANNIIAALKNGQSIDGYIAMVPESPDRYFKSKFLYTIAKNYPAKTPEVAQEMQTIAQRNELGAKQWDISRKPNWNLSDTQTMSKGDSK